MTTSQRGWDQGLDTSTEVSAPRPRALPDLRVPALTLLAHPDLRRVGERVLLPGLGSGRAVPLSRRTPLFAPPGGGAERPLADAHLSRSPIHLVPGEEPGSVRLAPEGGGSRFVLLGAASPGEISSAEL